jgi:hypothetical protein
MTQWEYRLLRADWFSADLMVHSTETTKGTTWRGRLGSYLTAICSDDSRRSVRRALEATAQHKKAIGAPIRIRRSSDATRRAADE